MLIVIACIVTIASFFYLLGKRIAPLYYSGGFLFLYGAINISNAWCLKSSIEYDLFITSLYMTGLPFLLWGILLLSIATYRAIKFRGKVNAG